MKIRPLPASDIDQLYDRRERNQVFAAAWSEAHEEAADTLEAEALRRAAQGVGEPVFYEGQEVGTVRRYSDQLLMHLLRVARPEKYRER